ncbi:MAG: hypothetical protein IT349_17380 [Candidatus Eisenbacteria bacterium]|nr:hypothetical protein [Candidatus Eisenbacteria bacterium]MCC7143873.1 hypothetical protein [Candidatus Eisenbacteria bacterium]
MKWHRLTSSLRAVSLLAAAGALSFAWHLTRIGAAGIEDVPPPFTLMAGLVGLGCLGLAVVGRYPRAGG